MDVHFSEVVDAQHSSPDVRGQAGDEEEPLQSWFEGQFWCLVGIVLGIAASMLGRMWTVQRGGVAAANHAKDFITFSTDNKMVLVVRTDLSMTKGKVAAQCAHAAIMCYKKASKQTPLLLKQWELFGQTKVTLKIDCEEAMQLLEVKAKSMDLVAAIVRDAGRTQIEAGSATVLGIGPAPASVINQITGHLKLY